MIVFIDANKYLQFLSAEGEELTSLSLLKKNLKKEKIQLLLPTVTQDEFKRVAPSLQARYINNLRNLEVKAPQFASVVRNKDRKKFIEGHIKKIKDELKRLESDYLKKIK